MDEGGDLAGSPSRGSMMISGSVTFIQGCGRWTTEQASAKASATSSVTATSRSGADRLIWGGIVFCAGSRSSRRGSGPAGWASSRVTVAAVGVLWVLLPIAVTIMFIDILVLYAFRLRRCDTDWV